jgi:gliding motility-associatede transport system auxiliary component
VRKSASIFGLLGLLFLAFGFVATAFVTSPASDPYVLLNVVVGAVFLAIYFVFGVENLRTLIGSRSTRYSAGAVIYSLLFVALVIGLNYLGSRHHKQWDVTEASVYTLSPQSKKVVEALKDKLVLTAFTDGGTNPQLQTILDGYRDAAPGTVETRMLDPDKEPSLAEQMKITTVPSVHIQFGNESFVVTQPTEETVTNGIIRVTRPGKKVVYFTEGFGEAGIQDPQDPKGFANAKLALEQENYEVKSLLLPSVEQIPDDASVVVLAGPTRPLTDAAIAALEASLKRGGRLLALAGPRIGGPKLAPFLAGWGVKVGDDIVIDREVRLFEGPRLGVVPLSRTYGTHPITQGFRDFTAYPQTSSIEPAAEGRKGLQATSLVKTSESSWAESDIDGVFVQGTASLDDKDRKGPVSIAVAATANLKEMGLTPPEGVTEARLVVFGTPLFIDNQQLAQSQLNGDLFLNAVGWLVGQEELVSIRSRSVRASRADLTPAQAARVFYLSVFIIPQLLIALGIWVWWRRRTA